MLCLNNNWIYLLVAYSSMVEQLAEVGLIVFHLQGILKGG